MSIREDDKKQILTLILKEIKKSQEYRDLYYKTQVLNRGVSNPELNLMTRGMHSKQVSDNAMRLAEKLDLSAEEILKAQVIGLAHDLGHTPIGHAGEMAISEYINESMGNGYFKHSHYGVKVFEKMIDEFIKDSQEDYQLNSEQIEYVQSIKIELTQGVRNHDIYYSYYLESSNETLAMNCGRLSDTLSFMASDMRDIMKADSAIANEKIVTDSSIDNLKIELEKTEGYEYLKIDEIKKNLVNGDLNDLATIQEKIIDEVAENNKGKEKIVSITDKYKYLREIDYAHKMGKDYASTLLQYDDYAKKNEKDYKPLDEKIRKSIEEKMKTNKGEHIINKLDEKVKKTLNMHYDKVISVEVGNERKELRRTCPTLATVYEMQDQLQYNELILAGKTKAFGNNEKLYNPMIKVLLKKYEEKYNNMTATEKTSEGKIVEFTKKPSLDYAIMKVQGLGNDQIDSILDKCVRQMGKEQIKKEEQSVEMVKTTPIEKINNIAKTTKANRTNKITIDR